MARSRHPGRNRGGVVAMTTPAKIHDQATLKLLIDNIANLEHPLGWIKHPYFQERFTGNADGVREMKKRYCEAIVLLLEKHDRLRSGKTTRKSAAKPRSFAWHATPWRWEHKTRTAKWT
jgi:hypothetical protein